MEVPLTNGLFALVDDEDAPRVLPYRWYAKCSGTGCYAMRRVIVDGKRTTMYMHRFVMDAGPEEVVDHINGNRLDNRRTNLRACAVQENNRNRSSGTGGSSQYKGVNWNTGSQAWQARIKVEGKQIHIGYYKKESRSI